jgi:acyl-CoA thioester hydrolase
VNEHPIRVAGFDIRHGEAMGIVVETACRFHKSLSFPDTSATGRFVHVWVDRERRRPVAIAPRVRTALETLWAAANAAP